MNSKVYKKFSLLNKTIINNMVSDKRRVLSTIVGIMGITALLVCAISLNNFIQRSFIEQFNNVTFYDTIIFESAIDNKNDEIKDYLRDKNISYAEIMSTYVILNTPDDEHILSSMFVVDDSQTFLRMFNIKNKNIKIENINGYYSSMSYQDEYNVSDGANISLTDMAGQEHIVKTETFFYYYLLQNQFIVDSNTYENDFNNKYVPNALIFNKNNVSLEDLKKDLLAFDGYINLIDFYTNSKDQFSSYAQVFIYIVGVYLLLAILMAFIVINNLLEMFVKEKKDELTILMINGFSKRQTRRYIYLDTIILTLIGVLLGVILGVFMGNLSLQANKTATIYLISGIDWLAILCGVFITVLLTFIVTIINLRKINKFKLRDISN